jgi:recombination protein RecT
MASENKTTAVERVSSLRTALERAQDSMRAVAPKYLKVDRVTKLLLAASSRTPKLMECTIESTLLFCMRCAESGLEPVGAGGAWPVPYFNNKTGKMEMQFIPDYRGLINSAKRAKLITDAYAEVVKENDTFHYTLGLNPDLTHEPASKDRGALTNAYCVFVLPDGTKRFAVMDSDEIKSIQKRSKAGGSGPWVTDEGEMWKKTVVRRAMKPFAGVSKELDAAVEADNDATGITVEPIAMPTKKELPEATEAKAEQSPAIPAAATPVEDKPAYDRAGAIAKAKALIDELSAQKIKLAMAEAGLNFEDDPLIDSLTDAVLEKLVMRLEQKRAKK